MAIDLTAIFATVAGITEELITTSSTTVTIERPTDEGTRTPDPVTFEVPDPTRTLIADDVQAIVAAIPSGLQGIQAGDLALQNVLPGDFRILMLPDVLDILYRDVITVKTCLDPRLVGKVTYVRMVLDSSAAACRLVVANESKVAV